MNHIMFNYVTIVE